MEKWEFNKFFPDFDLSAYRKSHEQGLKILSGPAGCEGFAVKDGNEILGLFEYYPDINGKPEIGLALNPQLIYKGLGKKVMDKGINYLHNRKKYSAKYIYLTVAVNNIPAIKFYEKYGFKKYMEVKSDNGEITDFKMRY